MYRFQFVHCQVAQIPFSQLPACSAMTSQSSDVEVRVDKVSFIVSGTVDIDRIYRALLDVLDDDASGGRVVIHERGVDTIELPRRFSNLEAIIHIKRHVPYVSQDDAPEAKRAKTS